MARNCLLWLNLLIGITFAILPKDEHEAFIKHSTFNCISTI